MLIAVYSSPRLAGSQQLQLLILMLCSLCRINKFIFNKCIDVHYIYEVCYLHSSSLDRIFIKQEMEKYSIQSRENFIVFVFDYRRHNVKQF